MYGRNLDRGEYIHFVVIDNKASNKDIEIICRWFRAAADVVIVENESPKFGEL